MVDLLIGVILGVAALLVLGWWVASLFGIGGEFLDPAGVVVRWSSRMARGANRRHNAKHPLPSNVPPAPPSP